MKGIFWWCQHTSSLCRWWIGGEELITGKKSGAEAWTLCLTLTWGKTGGSIAELQWWHVVVTQVDFLTTINVEAWQKIHVAFQHCKPHILYIFFHLSSFLLTYVHIDAMFYNHVIFWLNVLPFHPQKNALLLRPWVSLLASKSNTVCIAQCQQSMPLVAESQLLLISCLQNVLVSKTQQSCCHWW